MLNFYKVFNDTTRTLACFVLQRSPPFAGLFQSTAWPFLIPVIGNWFAKTNRSGLIMGMWNATSPVGDVSGALIASAILGAYGWEWSVVFSGLLILFLGVSVFLFLYVSPESAGFDMQNDGSGSYYRTKEEKEESLLLRSDRADEDHGQVTEELVALGFIEACKIPGVVPFALSLFFSKLVGYTFLYWLPFYISHTGMYLYDKLDSTYRLLESEIFIPH